ncbi:MAG: addiction module protein [Ideonella sp.]|nr:addiction module protein [Ideonella sp.]
MRSKQEVEAAWDAEIARRIQQIDSGDVEASRGKP